MTEEIDLDSFPLLRLDQLPVASDELLTDAISEVAAMLTSGESASSLGSYLERQLAKMRQELLLRQQRRLSKQREPSISPAQAQARDTKEVVNGYMRGSRHQADRPLHSRSAGAMKTVNWCRTGSAPQLNAAPMQSAEVIPFVVQATERKKRVLPKKAQEVSREERLDAERTARRDAAMERLQARKQRRQAMQKQAQRRKLRKRPTSSRSAGNHKPAMTNSPSSSDSESISGGDDELDDVSDGDGSVAAGITVEAERAGGKESEHIAVTEDSVPPEPVGATVVSKDDSADMVLREATADVVDKHTPCFIQCSESEAAVPSPSIGTEEGDAVEEEQPCSSRELDLQIVTTDAVAPTLEAQDMHTPEPAEKQPVESPVHGSDIDSITADADGASATTTDCNAGEHPGPSNPAKTPAQDGNINPAALHEAQVAKCAKIAEQSNNRKSVLLEPLDVSQNKPAEFVEAVEAVEPDQPVHSPIDCSVETAAVVDTSIVLNDTEIDSNSNPHSEGIELELQVNPQVATVNPQRVSEQAQRDMELTGNENKNEQRQILDAPSDSTSHEERQSHVETCASDVCPAEERGKQFTDYFPSFLHLFSGLYCSVGNISVESTTYRTLSAALEYQLKLYQEWIEIMKDLELALPSTSPSPNGDNRLGIDQYFRVNSSRSEVARIIKDAMSSSGFANQWHELPEGFGLKTSWNLLWTWSKPRINCMHLLACQKVNHFREIRNLTRKDLLKKHIERWSRLGEDGKPFQIMPATYWLPHEYTAFVTAFTQAASHSPQNIWIMKPIGLSRGRGISLVHDLSDLVYSQEVVMQQYISNPLLLDGYKFDLRLYVLVTSFQPLEVFIYKEGFARLSTRKYCTDADKLSDLFIHLTNSSIQTANESGMEADNPVATADAKDSGGTKLSLSEAWRMLKAKGFDIDALWQRICVVIVKSLVCVDDKIPHQPSAFELFGYDIIIDDNLQPWLLEVNSSPSMARGSALDRRIKDAVIHDVIALVSPIPYDRVALMEVFSRRVSEMRKKGPAHLLKADPLLESDLNKIFNGHFPRRCGELPAQLGNFERLCPGTNAYAQTMRLRRNLARLGPLPANY